MTSARSTLAARGAIFAVAAGFLVRPLTFTPGLLAAIVAAAAGTVAGQVLSRSRLRVAPVLAGAGLGTLVGLGTAEALVSLSSPAVLLGPVAALALGEVVRWTALAGPVVLVLRFLSARQPAVAVLEVVVLATSFALAFAAHRQGMVHRPYALGDWAWSRGLDPAWLLLGFGAAATLLLATFLIREQRTRRLPLHLATLALVALALLLLVRAEGLPTPDPAGDLGLTGDPEEGRPEDGERRDGESGGGGRSDQLDDLEFRDEYGNSGGQAPVAVVLLHDDWNPPSGVYYFRQSAFSQYNGRRLVSSTRDDVDGDLVDRFPTSPVTVPVQPPESPARRPLRTTTGLMVDHVHPFALDSPTRFAPVRNPDPMRFQRTFEAVSRVRDVPYDAMIGRRPGDPSWTDEQWRHYTEGPSDPRYDDMARELVSLLRPEYRDDPLGQALAVKAFLDREGIYSRRSQHSGADDPTASFLFGDKTGYCVHFAHAATYLFRSLGLPARVAAGYAVAESSRAGSSAILIRGLNAHAWPEVYLEELGWVVVDPAPEQSLDEAADAADSTLQRMLGEMLRQPSEALEDPEMRESLDLAALRRQLARILLGLLAAAYAVKLWRRQAPRFVAPGELSRVAYRSVLDRLAELGWSRRAGESREAFARRLSPIAPTFSRATEHHLSAALGGRGATPNRDAWQDLRRSVSREAAARRRPWRRILGILDPVPWLRAR